MPPVFAFEIMQQQKHLTEMHIQTYLGSSTHISFIIYSPDIKHQLVRNTKLNIAQKIIITSLD